jgi:hypothetical protein
MGFHGQGADELTIHYLEENAAARAAVGTDRRNKF